MELESDMSPEFESDMSPELWAALPEVCIAKVLQQSPFSSRIKFRLVCKEWNSLITSSSFACRCPRLESPNAVPILLPHQLVPCSSSRSNQASFFYLDQLTNSWRQHWFNVGHQTSNLSLIACSDGLMCFEAEDRQHYIVCNPLTQSWCDVVVPSEAGPSMSRAAGLLVCSETAGGKFELVVASFGHGDVEATTFVYSSAQGCWRKAAAAPAGLTQRGSLEFLSPGALMSEGSVYFSVREEEREYLYRWKVLKYNVEADSWTEAHADTTVIVHSGGLAFQLVKHWCEVLLVFSRMKKHWLPFGSYNFTRYHTMHSVVDSGVQGLRVVDEDFPIYVVRKIFSQQLKTGADLNSTSFAGHGDEIFVTCQSKDHEDSGVVHVAKFKPFEPSWHRLLPDWVPEDAESFSKGMKVWVLEPSLTACV